VACDEPLPREAALCAACSPSLLPAVASPTVAEAPPLVAVAAYGGALAVALRRYKYQSHSQLGAALGGLLCEGLRGKLPAPRGPLVVVPVPLHPRQLARRGYNQATALAAAIARELSAPLDCSALVRRRDTPPQARLDAANRRRNLAGAFAVPRGARVRGRSVLLVDDVATTGATLAACRSALDEAGALEVVAVVLARADPPAGAESRTIVSAAVGAW
jgi:ComF family protein